MPSAVAQVDDVELERVVRDHFARRVPGCEDVTITVRRGGRVVRTVVVDVVTPAAGDGSDAVVVRATG